MIRPEMRAFLSRWSEVLTGLGIAAFGLFSLQARGVFFQGLAVLVVLAGLGLALIGWRRLRFHREGAAPGVVQVIEGQISYYGPDTGGFIGIGDIIELHLIRSGKCWLLVGDDRTALEIPVSAAGADALFDAFASLPGLSTQTLLDALDATDQRRVLWRDPARATELKITGHRAW
jgi:hypothetical protein